MLALFALSAASSVARAQVTQTTQAAAPTALPTPENVQVEALAGFGFGTRAFERPTPTGKQRLDTVPFAAVDVGLRVLAWPTQRYSLEALLTYRSSVGLVIKEQPLFALPNDVGVRVSHTELSVAPMYRLWPNASSPRIALPMGLSLHSFWPETHVLQTPGFSLLGPHVRAELIAPLGPLVTLRVGPEVQWILVIDRAVRRDGIHGQGVGLGLEASIALQLVTHFGVELSYRQAHAIAEGRDRRPDFSDTERFATLRLVGRY